MRASIAVLSCLSSASILHGLILPQRPSIITSSSDGTFPESIAIAGPLSSLSLNQSLFLPNLVIRQLVAHRCLLYISRVPTSPLPDPQYRLTLSSALENIERVKDRVGGMAKVLRPIHVIDGNVVFTADNLVFKLQESLTFGILAEALRVLQDYFPTYPYESMVWVTPGLNEDSPGRAIGKLGLFVRPGQPIPTTGNAQIL